MLRNEVILLGAGASIRAGIPGAVSMVDRLLELVTRPIVTNSAWDYHIGKLVPAAAKTLPAVISVLRAWGAAQDPAIAVDIELVFNCIEVLRRFPESFHNAFFQLRELPELLEVRDLHVAAKFMKHAVVRFATVESEKAIEYLQPLVSPITSSSSRLVVATLNYDNAIELLAQKNGIAIDMDLTDKSPLVLLKLHGSIDWVLYRWEDQQEFPVNPILPMVVKGSPDWGREPAIIFGQENKLDANPPFLELFQLFKEELERSNRLTVIGYSFRDRHINLAILYWLLADGKRVLRVVDPTANNEQWFWTAMKTGRLGTHPHSYDSLVDDGRIVILSKKAEELSDADLWLA